MLEECPWLLASTPPNAVADPWQLDGHALSWSEARVPGTVLAENADDRDWWYRCAFEAQAHKKTLRFDGLATLAQVWLNGELILESDNMFRQYRVGVELREQNELVICFRSLDAALARRRPRPRWKTRLVRHQQLRWFRTSLMGRIPGWTPPTPMVGPWRSIEFDSGWDLRSRLDGSKGIVEISCGADAGTFSVGDMSVELHGGSATAVIENPALWWPHTHGEPHLYACSVTIGGETIHCGSVGFRTVDQYGEFGLRINGLPIFCRGACWTPGDLDALELLHDAGANMVRVGGTFYYEEDAFYRRCDELGLLVWQDFMFANMDYPAGDAAFVESVRIETTQQLQRLRAHPCVVVYCGNSEVEQQAAMLGAPRELWRNELFGEVLPALCGELHPETVYVPSTPSGGALPFHPSTGVTHYYGVGAYRRPITDVRHAGVRFAAECLGFANVPAQAVVDEVMEGDAFAAHDPRWKRRTPRDTGSPWDFEDVRDHYLRETFGVDPLQLRSFNPRRYVELSRVVTGQVMAQVYSEWRSARSTCNGALVWFLRDLWPGAGWGILDSRGMPKACFYELRRVWQPRTVVFTDEGLNGLHAHIINDRNEAFDGTLEIALLRDGHIVTAQATTPFHVEPRSVSTYEADAILGAFHDTAYAYRFGPPPHDVAIATLTLERRALGPSVIAEAFHFIQPPQRTTANVIADAKQTADGTWDLTLQSDRFLYAVHIDVDGAVAGNDYFHLVPNRPKTVALQGARVDGFVEAVNLSEAVRIGVTR
ncbi:MAG TPA: glycoside hydrolase family 2 protein [Thermoanaerobaculia bacterium]|nr:glycoside hydrolase family 2 protein [Thermoanaerobaculia bacterium]